MPILPAEPDHFPEELFSAESAAPRAPWSVARVRARREKCLARLLRGDEIPYYLPTRAKRAGPANASRTAHLPLFPGYVFFQGGSRQRRRAWETGTVVEVLPVPDQGQLHRELRALWSLQREGASLAPHTGLEPGDPVRIVKGPLRGVEGTLLRRQGRTRLVVRVTALQSCVASEIEEAWVRAARRRRAPHRAPPPESSSGGPRAW